jgi:hypothetical protein
MGTFIKTDWKSMYGDVKEMIPSDAPVPRVKEVDLRLFVDSDHSGEQFTGRSRTGFVIYLNMAPIVWFSKSHPTVESSVFGAEFVAMNNGIETWCGLHYKLIMMGVALSGPTYVYGDNMSVVHNTQRPESVLKKKSNSILYHEVCDSAVMGYSIIGNIPSVDNPADICTTVVPGGQKRNHLIRLLLHDLCDWTVRLIIPLSERFAGLGGFLVSWATKYIIIWVEFICALFPANLLLSQNNKISLRGLKKSTRRCACALLDVHGAALDINI